jgi:molybdopterin synthase catalytic subunit
MTIEPHLQIDFATDEINVSTASELPLIGCGGECVFIGRTRPETHSEHGNLTALQYDCYLDMARTELALIADEAITEFAVRCIRITHSVGDVPVHAASVVIAVGGNHRDEACNACRFLIDNLKTRVPIWKQELWETDKTWVVGETLEQTTP